MSSQSLILSQTTDLWPSSWKKGGTELK